MGFRPITTEAVNIVLAPRTLSHTLQASLNISAPRLIQRVPPNNLPGVTFVLPGTNLPSRKPYPRNSPTVGPQFDYGTQ